MRIVVVSPHFSEKMGYAENALPKALAKQGAEVHLITSDLQPNFPNYEIVYEPFLGPKRQPICTKEFNGFMLHRLLTGGIRSRRYLKGLFRKLADIRPDVVQCLTQRHLSTYQVAAAKLRLGFKLFLEEHTHMSVFAPPASFYRRMSLALYRATTAKVLSQLTELNYPIGPDVARISTRYFGFSPHKIKVYSMGVDSSIFHPINSEELRRNREETRREMGFDEDSIVCVYSGRFHPGKNPQCLAEAIERLRSTDKRFRGFFIGAGTDEEEAGIRSRSGCTIHPFVEACQLGNFYRATDIGVWPKQESLSQLDAAACGLPLILSDKVEVLERVKDNGFLYRENDPNDLAVKIATNLAEAAVRQSLGMQGAIRIQQRYTWDKVAADRLHDYEAALSPSGR